MAAKIVIVGNGIAGITAAQRIRELDPDVGIEIYTREPHHYYYRPRLLDLLSGEASPDEIITNPPEWYASRKIRVHLSTPVASVEPGEKSVVLEGGDRTGYDKLLVASGSDPFVPPLDGVEKAGVFVLRTIDDALSMRDYADGRKTAVVVGGGLLGLETARALTVLGLKVSVLEFFDRLLPRQLDDAGARILEASIAKLGIRVVTGAATARVAGEEAATGVVLESGAVVPGDLVVFSTGVRSATGYLSESGIDVEHGVVVDGSMRTNAPDVYAAGDAAEFEGVVWGIIPVALAQAGVAGTAIIGAPHEQYRGIAPHTILKIVGIDVFSAGTISCEDSSSRELIYEDAAAGTYRKVVVRDGRIIGAIVIGSRIGAQELNQMIADGTPVDRWGDAIVREDFDYTKALGSPS